MTSDRYDVIVIGGGIIGLAVALQAGIHFPHLRIAVLEKEIGVGRHQSRHNSGVIHSGIYYKPGSLKAKLCVEGARSMLQFCAEQRLPHKVCGKLIVATQEPELASLEELYRRGQANRVPGARLLSSEELREFEPHAKGLRALLVPGTGVTDYASVCEKYAQIAAGNGASIFTSARVTAVRRFPGEIAIETSRGSFLAKSLINCGGLFSDRIARMAGEKASAIIAPFRGEYYDLVPERSFLVRGLIYPVPDPTFPFLGVHFTRRIEGRVDAGPNAVLALRREGYHRADWSIRDLGSLLRFSGFWRMAAKHWRAGWVEFQRSTFKPALVRALQRLVPGVREEDLVPGDSGVRAQALARDGMLVDDFQFATSKNMLHVLNVPSPAATASLSIGTYVAKLAAKNWDWNRARET